MKVLNKDQKNILFFLLSVKHLFNMRFRKKSWPLLIHCSILIVFLIIINNSLFYFWNTGADLNQSELILEIEAILETRNSHFGNILKYSKIFGNICSKMCVFTNTLNTLKCQLSIIVVLYQCVIGNKWSKRHILHIVEKRLWEQTNLFFIQVTATVLFACKILEWITRHFLNGFLYSIFWRLVIHYDKMLSQGRRCGRAEWALSSLEFSHRFLIDFLTSAISVISVVWRDVQWFL